MTDDLDAQPVGDDEAGLPATDAERLRRARELRRPLGPRPTMGRHPGDASDHLPTFLTEQLPEVGTDGEDGPRTPPSRDLDEGELDVLSALIDLGITDAEAREAILLDRVPLVLTRNILEEKAEFTLEQVAELAEIDPEVLANLRAAQGLSVPEGYSQLDVTAAKQVAEMLDIFTIETLVRSSRARGNAVGSIVMSDLSVVRDELILPLRRAGADDVTIGIALAEAMKAIEPMARDTLVTMYQMQLRHMLSTELAASAVRSTQTQLRLAVGFVDIVGFTKLSARIDPSGLDELIDAFEGRVIDVVSQRPDVGVVKYLGDAVMLIGPDGCTLADAMLELTSEVDALVDAPVRGGMAVGEVLVRDGDYFGPAVNLAARLTDLTRPWRLLAGEEDLDDLRAQFKVHRLRSTRLRGIGSTRPGVVQRRLDEDELAALEERERLAREEVLKDQAGAASSD